MSRRVVIAALVIVCLVVGVVILHVTGRHSNVGSHRAPTDSLGDLTLTPVGTGSPDCEGTYRPGQQVHVFGNGFGTNATVKVYLDAPGSQAGESQVAALTADSSGSAKGSMQIPQAAAIFSTDRSMNGLAFINAIGLGPAGEHVDDTAMIEIALPGSACAT